MLMLEGAAAESGRADCAQEEEIAARGREGVKD